VIFFPYVIKKNNYKLNYLKKQCLNTSKNTKAKGDFLFIDNLVPDVVYVEVFTIQRKDGKWISQLNDRVYKLEKNYNRHPSSR